MIVLGLFRCVCDLKAETMFDSSFYTRRQREKCRKMAAHKILWAAIPWKKDLAKQVVLAPQGLSFLLTVWIPLLFQAQLTRLHYLSISHEQT